MVSPVGGGTAATSIWRALENAVHPAPPPQHAETLVLAEGRAELLRPPFEELPGKLHAMDLASRELMQADVQGDIRHLAAGVANGGGALPDDTPPHGNDFSAQFCAAQAQLAQLSILDAILTDHQTGQDPFATQRSGHQHSMPESLALLDFHTRVRLVCDLNVAHMAEYQPPQAGDTGQPSLSAPRGEATRNVDTGLGWLQMATLHRVMDASRATFMRTYRSEYGTDWRPMRFYHGQVGPTDLPSDDHVTKTRSLADAIAVHRLAMELREVAPPASGNPAAARSPAEAWMDHLEARVASSVMRHALFEQMNGISQLSKRLAAVVEAATAEKKSSGQGYGSASYGMRSDYKAPHVSAGDAGKLQAAADKFFTAVRKAYDAYEDGVRYAFQGEGFTDPPPDGVDWTPGAVSEAASRVDRGNGLLAAAAEPLAELNALLTEIGERRDFNGPIRLTDDQRQVAQLASRIQENLFFNVGEVPRIGELDTRRMYRDGTVHLATAHIRCDALHLGNVDEQTRREAKVRHLVSEDAVRDYWILRGPANMAVLLPEATPLPVEEEPAPAARIDEPAPAVVDQPGSGPAERSGGWRPSWWPSGGKS